MQQKNTSYARRDRLLTIEKEIRENWEKNQTY